jgi:hypothetical protein
MRRERGSEEGSRSDGSLMTTQPTCAKIKSFLFILDKPPIPAWLKFPGISHKLVMRKWYILVAKVVAAKEDHGACNNSGCEKALYVASPMM